MCTRPRQFGDVLVSCRSCDECLSSRIQGWVARAMAEKATSAFTYAVCLTYANDTQFRRDGSRAFRYSDIRRFLAAVRDAIKRRTGRTGLLRFICAGERGSDNGRVHWHLVLFSDYDILELGEWFKYGRPFVGSKLSGRQKWEKNRLNWSLWPHGFSEFEVPDDMGMAYALKYALKDQFSVKKSEGTGRITKAENYAASYFRMSKAPPIGHNWLWGRLESLLERGQMPVHMNFKVPDYWGYWYPSGLLRWDILRFLKWRVSAIFSETGCYPPQYAAFMASLSEHDLEMWNDEPETQEGEEILAASKRRAIEARERAILQSERLTRRRCGGFSPCVECRRGFGALESAKAEGYARHAEALARKSGFTGSDAEGRWAERRHEPNPYCVCKDASEVRRAFAPRSGFAD